MPQNDLTPARLRELIAAATPGPWTVETEEERELDGSVLGHDIAIPEINRLLHGEWADSGDWDRDLANAELIAYLATHASAMADALEAKELLEWAGKGVWCREYGWDGEGSIVDALRAAKEAAQST